MVDIQRAFQDCHDEVTQEFEPKEGIKQFSALSQLRSHCPDTLASSAGFFQGEEKWACDSNVAYFFILRIPFLIDDTGKLIIVKLASIQVIDFKSLHFKKVNKFEM